MIKFLKSFFLTLKGRFSKLQSPHSLKASISEEEKVARYIFSRSHFSRKSLRVKAEAYMPNGGEVSVFRTNGLDEATIWGIGSDLAKKRERVLYGRGDTIVSEIRKASLHIRSEEPPPRHANIVGWPENDKPRQKILALQIAAAATLVLNDS